jgi:hypothetical protein
MLSGMLLWLRPGGFCMHLLLCWGMCSVDTRTQSQPCDDCLDIRRPVMTLVPPTDAKHHTTFRLCTVPQLCFKTSR